jgi:hypothetical protein
MDLCLDQFAQVGQTQGEHQMGLFDKHNSSNALNTKVGNLLRQALPDVSFVEEGPGSWGARNESVLVRVIINTEDIPEQPFVDVIAFVLLNVKDDIKIYKYLMTEKSFIFNKWEVEAGEDKGSINLYLTARLLIDDLDASELGFAVASTAVIADGVDEEIQKKFGGKRCLEVFGWEE